MESVDFLQSVVDYQQRMLDDAEKAHAKVLMKYAKHAAVKLIIDEEVANAVADVEKTKQELSAAKAQLLAVNDQHSAARNDPDRTEGDI